MTSAPESDLPSLVSGDWLEARLGSQRLRVIDSSWYLAAEGIDGRAEYAEAHVPGAVYLDLSTDLADQTSGLRNTAPTPEETGRRFGRAGIGTDHDVVVYDRRGGFSAGRLWWLLRHAGHGRASLLDGGFGRWVAEGRATTAAVPSYDAAPFAVDPGPTWLSRRTDVLHNLQTRAAVVVDARSAARFHEEGHVPGSVSVPYGQNLTGDRAGFRPPDELRRMYEEAGVRFDAPVITTCGSGVTAALTAFALVRAGHPDVSVYDGSWDEWSKAPDTPIETG